MARSSKSRSSHSAVPARVGSCAGEPTAGFVAGLINQAADAVIGHDLAGVVTLWNRAAERLLGYTAAEAVGRPVGEVLVGSGPEDADLLSRVRSGEVVADLETLRRDKHGSLLPLTITAWPIRDDAGSIVGVGRLIRSTSVPKEAGQKLRSRLPEIMSSMESAGIGLSWLGADGTILWANTAELQMLGYSADEYIGRPAAAFHLDQDIVADLARGEQLRDREARMRCKDGAVKYVVIDSSVLRENGRVAHTQCFTRDLSRRKRMEAELHEAHLRAAQTLERITDGFLAVDTGWRITYMNPSAAEWLGRRRPAAEMLGRDIWSEFPELLGTVAEREYRRAMQDQVRAGFELHFPPLMGWFEVSVYPGPEGLSIYFREITERKRLDDALRQAAFVLNHSGWAVATIASRSNRIEFCNAAFARMHGRTIEEMTGLDLIETFAPEWRAEWPAHAAALGQGGDYVYESLHCKKDGSVFPVRTHATTFKDDAGRPRFRASVFEDITDQRAAEGKIRSSVTRLQLLADAARSLLETEDPLQLIERIFDSLAAAYRLDFFFHFVVEPDGGCLRLRGARGISKESAEQMEFLQFGEAVCGTAARDLKAVVVADVQRSNEPMTEVIRRLGITAYFCQPLVANGRLLGTLSFGTRQHEAFSSELVELITTLADMVATGLARQQTQDALRNSEALKTGILNSGLDAGVTIDAEGRIVEFNPAAERTFGYSRGEALGQLMAELIIPPAWREAHHRGMARYLQTGDSRIIGRRIEITAMRAGGAEFPCELTVARVPRDGPPLFTSFIRDITQRQRAEQALRESEERFRALADNIPQLAWMADPSGAIFWYNQRWFDYTGTTMDEMRGWGWQAVHHPEHLERVVAKFRATIERGAVWEDTFPLRDKDGRYRWFLSRAVPIRDGTGSIVRWFGSNTDVTDQLQKEHALAEQARLLDLSFDAIIVRDGEDRITFWNRGAQELYGWRADEALGQRSHDLLQTVFPAEFEQIDAELEKHGRWQGELLHSHRDGRRMTVITRWAVDRDAKGRRSGVLETNNDITVRRQTERALELAREELARRAADLEQAVAERTRDLRATIAELEGFSYSLSHDMRAPLRTIHSFSQIVLEEAGGKLGPLETDLLRKTIRAAARLDRLIQDVLTYSRVSREALELTPVNVEELLRQIISERPEFQPPKSVIEIVSPLCLVRGHEAYLTQCLTNLLDNAVKFVPAGRQPHVRVWTEPKEGHVLLWVEDNGIGIPPEAEDRLFGIFQRLHSEAAYPGTGIGLAIVRKAVDRMGGSVGLESQPGRGTRFWLRLQSGE